MDASIAVEFTTPLQPAAGLDSGLLFTANSPSVTYDGTIQQ